MQSSDKFLQLVSIIKKLRRECPWDRKQTHESLVKHLKEETFELIENIENGKFNEHLKEELGDVLLQVMLHSQIASEDNRFDIFDVVEYLNNKLIFRHPHVFGDVKVNSSEEALKVWKEMKKKEREKDGV